MFIRKSIKLTVLLLIIFSLAAMLTIFVQAVPANPFPRQVTQADGSIITIYNKGDEFFNWTEDIDGNVIARDSETGNWHYAYISNDNRILPGAQIVGARQSSQASKITSEDLEPFFDRAEIRKTERFDSSFMKPELGSSGVSRLSAKTNEQVVLILVEFNDTPLVESEEYWHNLYFSTNPGDVSMTNYYKEVSGGLNVFVPAQTKTIVTQGGTWHTKFEESLVSWVQTGTDVTITPSTYEGVIKVKLDMNHPIPTYDNISEEESYLLSRAIMELAIRAIHEKTGFSFNETKLHIGGVIAGFDRAGNYPNGDGRGQVWAHAWSFDSRVIDDYTIIEIDGVRYYTSKKYMLHGEMLDDNDTMQIGVAAHELGHTLGLLDLYDYTNNSRGVGPYSLMSDGSWGAAYGEIDGATPTHLDAWSKIELGYASPITIPYNQYQKTNVNSVSSGQYNILKITNTGKDSKQFFIVENRQFEGYDEGLERWFDPSANINGGIMIYHIDESVYAGHYYDSNERAWTGGLNDNYPHKTVDVEEAQGRSLDVTSWDINSASSNHFYVSGENNIFNNTSTPNTNFHIPGHTKNPFLTKPPTIVDCHPQTVATDIRISVNSASAQSMEVEVGPFVSVTDITDVPTTVAVGVTTINLTGTVVPSTATNRTITWSIVSGAVTGGTASITPQGTLTIPPTAVTGEQITVTATVTNGIENANYTKSDYTKDFTITIVDKIPLTITGLSVTTKTYDGTATATVTGTPALSGIQSGDTVSLKDTITGANFIDKNVGTGKAVTVTGLSLTGTHADKYIINPTISATGTITAKPITITGVTATNRAYDGTTTVALTGGTLVGTVINDDIGFTLNGGTVTTADAGNNKPVTVNTITLTGTDKDNYILTQPTGITVNITGKPLTITAVTAKNRVYDGTSIVVLENGTLQGVAAGDTVTLNLGTGTMANKNAGNGKAVTTNITLTGANAGSYTLTQPAGITVDIYKKPIEITGVTATNRVYDGTDVVALTGGTLAGVESGDDVTPIVPATGTIADENVENGKAVTIGTITLTGPDAGNYTLTQPTGITVNITAKAIFGFVTVDVDHTGSTDPNKIDEGDILTADVSGILPAGATFTYKWYRDGIYITGADNAPYTIDDLAVDPGGSIITVKVTGTGNYTGDVTSAEMEVAKIPLTGNITIDDTNGKDEGDKLELEISSILPGVTNSNYIIKWLRDGVEIPDATGEEYIITQDDLGKTITVVVIGIGEYTGGILSTKSVSISPVEPFAPVLTATAGNTQVNLSWTAPHDGGSPITKYEISVDSGAWTSVGLVTSHTVTGLTNGTTYTFKIRAVNSVGNGAESNAVSATPAAPPTGGNVTSPVIGGGTPVSSPPASTGTQEQTPSTNNGVTVNGSLSTINISANYDKGSVTFTSSPNKRANGSYYDSTFIIPVSVITDANKATKLTPPFGFRCESPAGTFVVPANLVSQIPDYTKLVAGKKQPVSVKVTISDNTAGTKADDLLSIVANFKLELVDGDGNVFAEIKDFAGNIERIIPLNKTKTAFYGAYVRQNQDSAWSFIPHKYIAPTKGNNGFVSILSNTNSDYAVFAYKPSFTDTTIGAWYYQDVMIAASKKLVQGIGNNLYAPENQLTRAHFVTMIVRVLRLPAAKDGTEAYSDVNKDDWFYADVMSAKSANLLTLLGGAEFKPNQAMTREEMAYVLARAAEYCGVKPTKKVVLKDKFTDSDSINNSYAKYVETAVSLELMQGMNATTFEGEGTITRAQAATVLVRMCKLFDWIDKID